MAPNAQPAETDAKRLNALVLEGLAPLQFTYDDVTTREVSVVNQLRFALQSVA